MHSIDELRQYVTLYYGEDRWDAFNPKAKDRDLPLDVLVRKFFSQLPTRTRMFREYVEYTFNDYVFPRISQNPTPKVLSLPCSNGEEVYTLAMLGFDKEIYLHVDGMDVNQELITTAENGELSLPWDRVKKLGEQIEKGYVRKTNSLPNIIVKPRVKERCRFFVHDILLNSLKDIQNEIDMTYDAIYCLNLFCYLTELGREEAVSNLIAGMVQGSVLVVDEPYWVPPPNTRESQARYNSRDEHLFGWKLDLNRFLETLHIEREGNDRGFDLRRISTGNYNVYEKI